MCFGVLSSYLNADLLIAVERLFFFAAVHRFCTFSTLWQQCGFDLLIVLLHTECKLHPYRHIHLQKFKENSPGCPHSDKSASAFTLAPRHPQAKGSRKGERPSISVSPPFAHKSAGESDVWNWQSNMPNKKPSAGKPGQAEKHGICAQSCSGLVVLSPIPDFSQNICFPGLHLVSQKRTCQHIQETRTGLSVWP